MPEAISLDAVDRAIIGQLQGGFPICPHPYAVAAAGLGISQEDLLARLQRTCSRACSACSKRAF